MIEKHISFRTFLKSALAQRCAKNPSYSLRAFAKQIGLSPSHLSRVLNGTKMLSMAAAMNVAAELQLKEPELTHFIDLIQLELTNEDGRNIILERMEKRTRKQPVRTIDLEIFKVISDWHCLPLLELIKTKSFRSDPKWMAKRLGVSVAEINETLDRLSRLGIIEVVNNQITCISQDYIKTSNDIASAAVKKHHAQMIDKAAKALVEEPVEEREFQAFNFAFHPKQMKKAKQAIRDFAEKFNAEYGGVGEEVYQLNVQFFKLTKKLKEN